MSAVPSTAPTSAAPRDAGPSTVVPPNAAALRGLWPTARHEWVSARREQLPRALLVVFLGMVSLSALIGWLTNRTVTQVYEQTRADGLTTAANPFTGVSPLFYVRNTVIYLVLIGALLAIVLGATSALRGRAAGTADLVLTRPVGRVGYLVGVLAGAAGWLGVVLAAAAAISWAVTAVLSGGALGVVDTVRLAAFFALSWLFLLVFVVLGMLSGFLGRRTTTALLVPIAGWAVLTFVVPQLGTAATPVSLLNPVPAVAVEGGPFALAHTLLGPLALTEHFKATSAALLRNDLVTGGAVAGVAAIVIALAAVTVLLLLVPRNRLRSALDD